MEWLAYLIPLYLAYYTLRFAQYVWNKEENLLAALLLVLLATALLVLPVLLHLR